MTSSTPNRRLRIIIILLLIIIVLLLLFRCCCCKMPPAKTYSHGIVFWQNPNSSNQRFRHWVDSILIVIRGKGEVNDSAYCSSCDSTLIAYTGVGTELYLSQGGSGGTGGTGGVGVHGDDGPGYFAANVDIVEPYIPLEPIKDSLLAKDSIGTGGKIDSTSSRFRGSRGKYPGGDGSGTGIGSGTSSGTGGGTGGGTGSGGASSTKTTVTVGVLDTGDTLAFPRDKAFLGTVTQSCISDPDSRHGWNFTVPNANTYDDHVHKHGTKVTQFIIDQAAQYEAATIQPPTNRVKFVPVKTFGANGKATLFDQLCAVAYAAKGGIKIINASFGFYEYPDTANSRCSARFMSEFLDYYLLKYNMLIVAAAGNQILDEDVKYRQVIGIPLANPRNLDSNPFYPACLVNDPYLTNNILVVTTVNVVNGTNSGTMSPLQNFSKKIVDVGVACDRVILVDTTKYYCFKDPLWVPANSTDYNVATVTGSSFATPIVTGKIASYYETLIGNRKIDKPAIIRMMENIHPFAQNRLTLLNTNVSNLVDSIKNNVTGVKRE